MYMNNSTVRVVIFVSARHLFVSGLCIKYLSNLKESYSNLTVITPDVQRNQEFYNWLGYNHVQILSDKEICHHLGIDKDNLDWLTKQWAILNLDQIFDDEVFFNLDADVILNTDLKLFKNNATIFYLESEYHQPYFNTIQDLFGISKKLPQNDSFIADFMVFERQYLLEMRHSSVKLSDYLTWRSIVESNTLDKQSVSAMSEYETYGTWLYEKYPERMILNREKSTYGNWANNLKYNNFIPTKENLNHTKDIIPLRQTAYDDEDYWGLIYPAGWETFKRID